MRLPVIHFETLIDMMNEFVSEGRQTIRVCRQQRSEIRNGAYGGVKTITIDVFVRAIHREKEIFSYTAFNEVVRIDGRTDSQAAKKAYNEAWDGANSTKVQIIFAIHEHGHDVRPGIIDLGGVEPVVGKRWPLGGDE